MFRRLGSWCYDRRRLVLVLWIVALFLGNSIAGGIGDAYRADVSLDGFESTDGFALLKSKFADGSGSSQTGQIVFEAERGVSMRTMVTSKRTAVASPQPTPSRLSAGAE